jgi:hypothetical protein
LKLIIKIEKPGNFGVFFNKIHKKLNYWKKLGILKKSWKIEKIPKKIPSKIKVEFPFLYGFCSSTTINNYFFII